MIDTDRNLILVVSQYARLEETYNELRRLLNLALLEHHPDRGGSERMTRRLIATKRQVERIYKSLKKP